MNRAAWLVAALAAASGCKDAGDKAKGGAKVESNSAKGEQPAATAEQIAGLLVGLDAVTGAAPDMRVAFLAQLMHETVAATDECFADAGDELTNGQELDLDRIAACAQPCPLDVAKLARMAPETRIAAIRTQCKEALGLADDDLNLLTPQLLLTARAARLLADAHSSAPEAHKDELGERMEHLKIVLPMPAWTQSYRLPVAPAAVSRPIMATRYLTVTADGQVLHSAPHARFADGHVDVEQPEPEPPTAVGAPPNPHLHDTSVAIERQKRRDELDKPADDPQLLREQAIEQARKSGILGLVDEQQRPAPDILLLADAQTSARAVIEAAQAAGGTMLGVAGDGATAWALLVGSTDDPDHRIRIGPSAVTPSVTIVIADTGVVATGEDREPSTIPRAGNAIDSEAVRDVVREWRAIPELPEIDDIAIEVTGEVSYRDLVDVISALAQDAPFVFYPRVSDK